MKRRIFTVLLGCLFQLTAFSQEMAIDTTDASFQLGKKIGSWIPVTVILVIAILFIRHTFKFRNDKGNINFD